MAALAHQHGAAPMQAVGQQQAHRIGPGGIQQGIGLEPIRQGTSQGIKESPIAKALQLAAAAGRRHK